jgi:outer membrane receptor for ferrienterochelin and colicin
MPYTIKRVKCSDGAEDRSAGTHQRLEMESSSVNVDQDGKISLRGNENVRVLVDGRPSNIEASGIKTNHLPLKKIELITNPSAKYNPEGMSGIINVCFKKAMLGLAGINSILLTFAQTHKNIQHHELQNRKE